MPSIKTLTPILGGNYYHIFNRGSNRHNIFFIPENYEYFLMQLKKFLGDYVHFLAYALLPNHFHLVIKVKDEIVMENEGNRSLEKENGSLSITDEEKIGRLVVKQLKRMFITYAMAINKQENRVGNVFDPKYKRLEINSQEYLQYAIFYVHYNPEKHGIIENFKKYRYSSFKALTGTTKTRIDRKLVMEIFEDKEGFLNYHDVLHEERSKVILE
ncbi:MAG TPA: hypothetical protein VKA38_02300 [Draconibacterium sp.]|nr:hypothetical protein [Draconibacterium sp.]